MLSDKVNSKMKCSTCYYRNVCFYLLCLSQMMIQRFMFVFILKIQKMILNFLQFQIKGLRNKLY